MNLKSVFYEQEVAFVWTLNPSKFAKEFVLLNPLALYKSFAL
jgi:hypothetical protein